MPSKQDKKRNTSLNKIKESNNKNKKYRKDIKKLKQQHKLYEECSTKISEIFQTDSISQSNRKFNTLYNRRQYLPKDISNYLENFEKDKDKLFNYMENTKIPKTNNLIERFYKYTMEEYYKGRFITSQGIHMFLDLNEIKWYEEVIFQQENRNPNKQSLAEPYSQNNSTHKIFNFAYPFTVFSESQIS